MKTIQRTSREQKQEEKLYASFPQPNYPVPIVNEYLSFPNNAYHPQRQQLGYTSQAKKYIGSDTGSET